MTHYLNNEIQFKKPYTSNEIEHLLFAITPRDAYLVFPWDKAPKCLRETCCYNGGDEDWMIIVHKDVLLNKDGLMEYVPWIDKTDTNNDPDIYYIGDFIIFVGCHA